LHGLKGEAGMMGYSEIADLAHAMEDVLLLAERKQFLLSATSTDALLSSCDAVATLAGVREGERPDVPELKRWLQAAQASLADIVKSAASSQSAGTLADAANQPERGRSRKSPTPTENGSAASRGFESDGSVRIGQKGLERLTSVVSSFRQLQRRRKSRLESMRGLLLAVRSLEQAIVSSGDGATSTIQALASLKDAISEQERDGVALASDEESRLEVLSEEVEAIRMVPLEVLLEPYPRMARELARDLAKSVRMTIDGEGLLVDRIVLNALKDPLMHMVRNSVDHGIETSDVRRLRGKSETGEIRIEARREGDRLLIRIADDGAGIDTVKIREIALSRGFASAQELDELDDDGTLDLLFLPGFTSRDEVSETSGRGVGLEVVRAQIRSLGGEVTIESALARGTSFEIRVPVTLTVAPVLFVVSAGERPSIPVSSVVEVVPTEQLEARLIGRKMWGLHGGERVPLISIAKALGFEVQEAWKEPLALIMRSRGQVAAVLVDEVLEEQDQSILPLGPILKSLPHFSGATVLSDGSLSMVLAVDALVDMAYERKPAVAQASPVTSTAIRGKILVVDDSPLTRDLLAGVLQSAGHIPTVVSNAFDALALLAQKPFDLVVTDLEMPEVDGFELTRRIKTTAAFSHLGVLIVSTRASAADRAKGLEVGADAYVTKGDLIRQDLIEAVERLLPFPSMADA
jgi:two-component system, chemotaxis family, sensor kinase CheA